MQNDLAAGIEIADPVEIDTFFQHAKVDDVVIGPDEPAQKSFSGQVEELEKGVPVVTYADETVGCRQRAALAVRVVDSRGTETGGVFRILVQDDAVFGVAGKFDLGTIDDQSAVY